MDTRTSIILVTYCPSQERYELCQQCFSTIHQTGLKRKEYELIVVNNGGIHQELVDKLDKDIEIRNKINIGLAEGRNQGIILSKGDYLAIVDDDLFFKNNWLKTGIELLEKYKKERILVSLRAIRNWKRYLMRWVDDYPIVNKVGAIWIFEKKIIRKYGYFKEGYSIEREYSKRFKKDGYLFLLSKNPYIFHLGEKKSIIYRDKEKYNEWFQNFSRNISQKRKSSNSLDNL
jgi:glycosyltransferase involved in cell wall biosynthesis